MTTHNGSSYTRDQNGLLFARVCNLETLLRAAIRASRKCPGSLARAEFLIQMAPNCQKILENLQSKNYKWGPYQSKEVCDPKRRVIHKAPFCDRVVHQAIAEVLNPILEQHLIYHTYACRTGKGTHAALQLALKWVKRKPYALRLDVSKYFASVSHELLLKKLAKIVYDKDLLLLLEDLIFTFSPGIPIGNLTSQLFANFYLNDLDQFIKRKLKVKEYIRYMDDFLILAASPAQAWEIRDAIVEFAASENLNFPHRKTSVHPTAAGVPFLGYRLFSNSRPRMHKRKLRRLRQCLSKASTQKNAAQSRWKTIAGWYGSAKLGLTQKLAEDLNIASEFERLNRTARQEQPAGSDNSEELSHFTALGNSYSRCKTQNIV